MDSRELKALEEGVVVGYLEKYPCRQSPEEYLEEIVDSLGNSLAGEYLQSMFNPLLGRIYQSIN